MMILDIVPNRNECSNRDSDRNLGSAKRERCKATATGSRQETMGRRSKC